ncbi:tail fiber assembly protein [Enterobacter pseudoroggenkampii]|uniref:tail fiber assembly protein n=1 Tax=Enterobacter pseudoroggenkampii TaxID=2996112 RepID=UPI0004648578
MITLKNFVQYEPEYKDFMFNAIFLQSEDGLDWYYHMSRFQTDTLKVCYDKNNIIRSYSNQVDRLFPLGMSVSEVDQADVPEGLNIHGEWAWNGIKIIPRELTQDEEIQQAKTRKSELLVEASDIIAPLQDASDLGIVTDEEAASLLLWKRYRVMLNRLDLSTAPAIDWPERPA